MYSFWWSQVEPLIPLNKNTNPTIPINWIIASCKAGHTQLRSATCWCPDANCRPQPLTSHIKLYYTVTAARELGIEHKLMLGHLASHSDSTLTTHWQTRHTSLDLAGQLPGHWLTPPQGSWGNVSHSQGQCHHQCQPNCHVTTSWTPSLNHYFWMPYMPYNNDIQPVTGVTDPPTQAPRLTHTLHCSMPEQQISLHSLPNPLHVSELKGLTEALKKWNCPTSAPVPVDFWAKLHPSSSFRAGDRLCWHVQTLKCEVTYDNTAHAMLHSNFLDSYWTWDTFLLRRSKDDSNMFDEFASCSLHAWTNNNTPLTLLHKAHHWHSCQVALRKARLVSASYLCCCAKFNCILSLSIDFNTCKLPSNSLS